MAGGGEGLGGGAKQKRGGTGKRKVKKRVGFRLDMTPLVDITFLLLTFFMLTTSMITPQTMEMKIPPQEEQVEVPMSKLLTIRVREDGAFFYNMGEDAPQKLTLDGLRKVVIDQNVALDNKCIVVLKASSQVNYGAAVKVLDMLNAAEPEITEKLRQKGFDKRERKFTVAPYEKKDAEEVAGL